MQKRDRDEEGATAKRADLEEVTMCLSLGFPRRQRASHQVPALVPPEGAVCNHASTRTNRALTLLHLAVTKDSSRPKSPVGATA